MCFSILKSDSGRLGIAQAIALGHNLVIDNSPAPVQKEKTNNDNQVQSLQAELIYKLVL